MKFTVTVLAILFASTSMCAPPAVSCSICLNDQANDDGSIGPIVQGGVVRTSCNHSFHQDCLQQWTKGQSNVLKIEMEGRSGPSALMMDSKMTCPNCRSEINSFHDAESGAQLSVEDFATVKELHFSQLDQKLTFFSGGHFMIGLQFIISSLEADGTELFEKVQDRLEELILAVRDRKRQRSQQIMALEDGASVPKEIEIAMQRDNDSLEGIEKAKAYIDKKLAILKQAEKMQALSDKAKALTREFEEIRETVENLPDAGIFFYSIKRIKSQLDSVMKQLKQERDVYEKLTRDEQA